MKTLCITMAFAVLFTGCYSRTAITKDTPSPPPDSDVIFELQDGSHIHATNYQRGEGGYQITGKKFIPDKFQYLRGPFDFSGFVRDEEIRSAGISEFDSTTTIVVIGGVLIVVGIITYVAMESAFDHMFDGGFNR